MPDGAVMVTLKIARFNPGGSRRRRLAELPGAVPAHRPPAQPAALRQVVSGRHADVPAVVRARRVRLGCDADQRRQPAGVQGADARPAAEEAGQAADDHHRTDPRPAGGEGPRGRHGAVLRRVPGGQAVPGRSAATRRPASGSRARPTAPATTTPPSASCARAAPPAAPSTGARAAISDRPPSSTPTGSSSTAATRRPPNASTSSTRSTGSGAAVPPSTAPSRARAASR